MKRQFLSIFSIVLFMNLSCVKDSTLDSPQTNLQVQDDLSAQIVGIYEGFNIIAGMPDSSGTHPENIQITKVSNDSVLIAGDQVKLLKDATGLSFIFQSKKTGSGKYYFDNKKVTFKYLLPIRIITNQGTTDGTKDYSYDGTKK